jgi:hypothetical protein
MKISRIQSGQSMVEFMIITPVMLLLVFGALQFALMYHAKTALNYAAFEAARAGALSNAQTAIIENAFARGMAPIYTHDDTVAEVEQARDRVRRDISNGLVFFEMINPNTNAFADFGVDLYGDGDIYIPNDNLMYRPINKGGTSEITVQDANLLKLRITYCYPLYVPFVNQFIIRLMKSMPTEDEPWNAGNQLAAGSPNEACLNTRSPDDDKWMEPLPDEVQARFPLVAQAIVRMQSAAIQPPSAGMGSGPSIVWTGGTF